MTNRCNPQHGSNMVDRYIGSSFDVVYAVYKIVDQLPMIYNFAVEYLPELERLDLEKVDKEEGKGLSSEDFTTELKLKLNSFETYDDTEIRGLLGAKVDKVAGKGLSSNDFTQAYRNQLEALGSASLEDTSAFDASGSATAALNEAKLYTDTEISNEALRTDLAITSAREYVDTEISTVNSAITSARGYTDTQISDLTLHTEALHNSAKLYTDTHLATARDYSDGILVQAKSYTDTRELALIALIQAQATTIGNLSGSITTLEQALQDAEQAIQSLTTRVTDLEGAVNP